MDIVEHVTPPPSPGDRVVIRHRLADGSATDVIGCVTELNALLVTVEDRRGRAQVIARDKIIIIKRVPAIPRGRNPGWAEAESLERAAARGWADEVQPLGDWLLQAGGGYTSRANSCLAIGSPECALSLAADRIMTFASLHGIAPKARVIHGSDPEDALRSLGWREGAGDAQVRVMRLSDLLANRTLEQRLELSIELSTDWLDAFRAAHPRTQVAPEAAARILAGAPTTCAFASLTGKEGIVALGRTHVAGEWASLTGLWTSPKRRRQGNLTRIVVGLATWASRRGARNVQIRVAAGNTLATDVYQHLGFEHHHDYGYLVPPADR